MSFLLKNNLIALVAFVGIGIVVFPLNMMWIHAIWSDAMFKMGFSVLFFQWLKICLHTTVSLGLCFWAGRKYLRHSENIKENVFSVAGPILFALVSAFTTPDSLLHFMSISIMPIIPMGVTIAYFSQMDIGFCCFIMSFFPSLCMWVGMNNKRYVKNYFAAVGLLKGHTYGKVREVYGEPAVLILEDGHVSIQYDGIEFLVMGGPEAVAGGLEAVADEDIVSAVRIYSPEYRFGRWKMRVGFSKADIEKIYKGFRKTMGLDCGFFDGRYRIGFGFDENQEVNKIVVYYSGANAGFPPLFTQPI